MLIGGAKGGEHQTISRGLMRFNISDWNGRDITLKIYCIIKEGSPGELEIYLINDFGELPPEPQGDPQNPDDPGDVTYYWNLYQTGIKVGSVQLEAGSWLTITIPGDKVADYKTGSGVIAFMFKLADESGTYDYYGLETYEYADKANIELPYIEWGP